MGRAYLVIVGGNDSTIRELSTTKGSQSFLSYLRVLKLDEDLSNSRRASRASRPWNLQLKDITIFPELAVYVVINFLKLSELAFPPCYHKRQLTYLHTPRCP